MNENLVYNSIDRVIILWFTSEMALLVSVFITRVSCHLLSELLRYFLKKLPNTEVVVYFLNSINKHLTLLVILKAPMPGTWNAVIIYDCCWVLVLSIAREQVFAYHDQSRIWVWKWRLYCGCPEMKTVNATAG